MALPAFDREIRFALVLYGGASLAVYIHGVTLEFFHLVRATATGPDGNWLLSDAELSGAERVYRRLGSIAGARFLVDIASGTSAGGINAIFLGKALANGQPLDGLSQLWLDRAEARDLLNRDTLPRSLLSSTTLHARLLEALDAMEPATIPLQAEVDVFITATDIQGLDLPIELADRTVFEKRHKSVFHLRWGDGENRFTRAHNPFLASVARATSAFPFAFEPVCLEGRVFSDGGCLDNKPFRHAVDALSRRASELPATRKLMYVEPSPEAPSGNGAAPPPDFLQNTLAALRLPREETIREDVRRVIERNRLIERMREITAHADADVLAWTARRLGGAQYQRRTLAEEVHDRGPGYAGYHRLKVWAVTEELASMLAKPRAEVEAWRRARFSEQDPENSEARFLLEYDLGYRRRRLRYLLREIADPEVRKQLARIAATLRPPCAFQSPAAVSGCLRELFLRAASDTEACLGADAPRYLERFEYYDQISFPVFYEASVGEAELCEVYRISPRDPAKLAGRKLFHFGAFLSREWRQNDLCWGRRDAAERIIQTTLPPGSPHAAPLILEAHRAIGTICPVIRKLPLRTRLSLGFRAGWVVLRMLAGYFIQTRARSTISAPAANTTAAASSQ